MMQTIPTVTQTSTREPRIGDRIYVRAASAERGTIVDIIEIRAITLYCIRWDDPQLGQGALYRHEFELEEMQADTRENSKMRKGKPTTYFKLFLKEPIKHFEIVPGLYVSLGVWTEGRYEPRYKSAPARLTLAVDFSDQPLVITGWAAIAGSKCLLELVKRQMEEEARLFTDECADVIADEYADTDVEELGAKTQGAPHEPREAILMQGIGFLTGLDTWKESKDMALGRSDEGMVYWQRHGSACVSIDWLSPAMLHPKLFMDRLGRPGWLQITWSPLSEATQTILAEPFKEGEGGD